MPDQILPDLLHACYSASEAILLHRYSQSESTAESRVKDGLDPRTIVTVADLESEQAILSILRDALPCDFLTEESGAIESSRKRDWRAIIDPLDGSRNFADRTLGMFGVSIALENHGELVAGTVGLPFFREAIVGQRGGGVTLFRNRKAAPLRETGAVSANRVESARVSLGRGGAPASVLASPPLNRILSTANECVNYGSCTVGLAAVLTGRVDALVLPGQRLWDFAAGKLLMEEVGGGFGVWTENWATRATPSMLQSAGASSMFDIVAATDLELYRALQEIVTGH